MENEQLQAGVNTHENVIFACSGGFSNTGLTTILASLEAVKEVGLKKASIGCLGALPLKSEPVRKKVDAAYKVITVDGCPIECARKLAEAASVEIARSINLVRDIGMTKQPLSQDIGKDLKNVADYISDDEVARAARLICEALASDEQK